MQVTVRELRSNLSKYLKEGCVVIDGKTKEAIAKIITPSEKSLKEKYELQSQYVKQLEKQTIKPIIKSEVKLDDGSVAELTYPGGIKIVEKPKQYIPQPCQFYRKCDDLSVGIFTLGQIVNGTWIEVPNKHLCQKHADFVVRDKAACWDL